jgi:hypothetical protein
VRRIEAERGGIDLFGVRQLITREVRQSRASCLRRQFFIEKRREVDVALDPP